MVRNRCHRVRCASPLATKRVCRVSRWDARQSRFENSEPPRPWSEIAPFVCHLRPERLRLLASNPTEKARLMLPEIQRVCQHWPSLDPDNLLVNECSGLIPDRFEHHLTARCVPAVPRGITGNRVLDRHVHEP